MKVQALGIVVATSEKHRVCLLDRVGRVVGERDVAHDGAALTDLCEWLIDKSCAEPARIAIAIEMPHGPIVEMLLERGFAVYAINPKQMDRFRDRFTVAGAKDDSRDAECWAIRCAPTVAPFAAFAPTNPWSSNCASGRAWPTTLSRSAIAWPIACESSCGATTRRC